VTAHESLTEPILNFFKEYLRRIHGANTTQKSSVFVLFCVNGSVIGRFWSNNMPLVLNSATKLNKSVESLVWFHQKSGILWQVIERPPWSNVTKTTKNKQR
jgi:hypothetical protein